ncbi:hypothetical protein BDR26DRAFT_867610, partial [Obelidium mucronatum]
VWTNIIAHSYTGNIAHLKQLCHLNKSIFTYTWTTPVFKCQVVFAITTTTTLTTTTKTHGLGSHKAFMNAIYNLSHYNHPKDSVACVKYLLESGILRYNENQVPNVLYRFQDWFDDDSSEEEDEEEEEEEEEEESRGGKKEILSLLSLYGFKRPLDGVVLKDADECRNQVHTILKTSFPESYRLGWLYEPGWVRVVWRLCERLEELGTEHPFFCDYKAKWGKMRVDLCSSCFDGELAEDESGTVCWKCGEDGQVRNELGWVQTLCGECLTGLK